MTRSKANPKRARKALPRVTYDELIARPVWEPVPVWIGIDVGGNKTAITVLDGRGCKVIENKFWCFPSCTIDGPQAAAQAIKNALKFLMSALKLQKEHIRGVGLGSPGPANKLGKMGKAGSPNMPHKLWAGASFGEIVAKTIGHPIIYINDGNAAALWSSFKLKLPNLIQFTVGSGLGGGGCVNGHLIEGTDGAGFELGHVWIPESEFKRMAIEVGVSADSLKDFTPTCGCGRQWDAESIASIRGVRNMLETLFPNLLANEPNLDNRAKLVLGAAVRGDEEARKLFTLQAIAIALLFRQLVTIFDDPTLVLGGGVTQQGEQFAMWFLGEVKKAARKLLTPEHKKRAHYAIAADQDNAGASGAALHALRQ